MTITVEGIGGTGKAIVNLLRFKQDVATAAGVLAPPIEFRVTDQDDNGVWADVPVLKPTERQGALVDLLGITTPMQRAAALGLFSEEELRLNVASGFGGKPKAARAVLGDDLRGAHSYPSDTIVLVYSDIGGTGAGVGPLTLRRFLADGSKICVVAIVLGKYLSTGAPRPTGLAWLGRYAHLDPDEGRWLDCYYLNVPPVAVSGTPPASGLNETPALLLASNFIWRLAESTAAGQRDTFLRFASRTDERRIVKPVSFGGDSRFALDGDDFVGRLHASGISGLLNPIVRRGEEFRNVAIRNVISSSVIADEVWRVISAPQPTGAALPENVDHTTGFASTYTSVPEVWAAADWFHESVLANPTGIAAKRFRKLAELYVNGKLHVVPTHWTPRSPGQLYALSLRHFDEDDGGLELTANSNVVGFFTSERPFWTTAEYATNLDNAARSRNRTLIQVRVDEASSLGQLLRDRDTLEHSLPEGDGVNAIVQLSSVTRQELSDWSWSVRRTVSGWTGLDEIVREWPLLDRAVELLSGSTTIRNKPHLQIRGLKLRDTLLSEQDHIVASDGRGVEYYEIAMTASDDQRLSIRRVLGFRPPKMSVQLQGDVDVGFVCGNIEIVIEESAR